MKVHCHGLCVLAVSAASGQQQEPVEKQDLLHFHFDSTKKVNWKPPFLKSPGNAGMLPLNKELKGQLNFTLTNGDQVYQLPVDRMPCVKPGNQYVYTMPVRKEKTEITADKAGTIPNPAL